MNAACKFNQKFQSHLKGIFNSKALQKVKLNARKHKMNERNILKPFPYSFEFECRIINFKSSERTTKQFLQSRKVFSWFSVQKRNFTLFIFSKPRKRRPNSLSTALPFVFANIENKQKRTQADQKTLLWII